MPYQRDGDEWDEYGDLLRPSSEPIQPPCKHEALAVLSDAMADTYEGGAMIHTGIAYYNLKVAQSEMANKLIPEAMEEFDEWRAGLE